jgi:predicted GNAT superfamily acetyltransferase
MGYPAECRGLAVRAAKPGDFDTIIAVIDDWWGRPASRDLTRLFLDHFCDTSLIAEHDGQLAGFVIGFLSHSKPEQAYIHFAGVGPAWRRAGLARSLYEQFFDRARNDGRTVVKAITSAGNGRSIAFHQAMGFTASDPIKDYDGPSLDRVVFVRSLSG